jgi:hypothetical protein
MGNPYAAAFTVAMGAAQYKQQGAIGKFNQSVANRNAAVLEGQATQIEQKAEFDIAQFQKDFRKMEGQTTVALAKSGVELGTGTAYNIELSNAYEAKLQENLIRYNSEVAVNNKMEEANFARIRGSMARQQAKMAQINTIAQTGTSLMSMGGSSGGGSQGQFGSTANNSTFSNYS